MKEKSTIQYPFRVLGLEPDDEFARVRFGDRDVTPGQREALFRVGLKADDIDALCRADASKLLGAAAIRQKHDLANYKQLKVLQRFGVTETNISFRNAGNAITYIKSCGWKVGSPPRLMQILHPLETGDGGTKS